MVALQEKPVQRQDTPDFYPEIKIPNEIQDILDSERSYRRPDRWPRKKSLQLRTLRDKVNEFSLYMAMKVTPALGRLVDSGYGRERQGQTQGRENEDNIITLDLIAEKFEGQRTLKYAKRTDLSVAVISEHADLIQDDDPDVVIFRDPTENSGEREAGYGSVAQYFTESYFSRKGATKGEAVAAICCNLVNGHTFINRNGKNYEVNPNTGDVIELFKPKKIYSIFDPDFRPVTYSGKYKYTKAFNDNFDKLDRDRDQNQIIQRVSGSHIYGDGIATGSASAYIMHNEPVSEIAEGIPFARDAGYVVASVDPETGEWEEYDFDYEYYLKNPDKYREDRVKMFIVASTKELLKEIIFYGFSKNLDAAVFRDTSPDKSFQNDEDANIEEPIKEILKPTEEDLIEGKIKYLPGIEEIAKKAVIRRKNVSLVK